MMGYGKEIVEGRALHGTLYIGLPNVPHGYTLSHMYPSRINYFEFYLGLAGCLNSYSLL
jgi:hypothetical protein